MENTYEIGVSLESNLDFKIRVFIWGRANDLRLCKKYGKPITYIILYNLIKEIIQFQICEGSSRNAKVLQLD